jgi:hypothetical protein
MQDSLFPGLRVQFEGNAPTPNAAFACGTVQIAALTQGQVAGRVPSVIPIKKAVKYVLFPGLRIHFENNAFQPSPVSGGTVEITFRVGD